MIPKTIPHPDGLPTTQGHVHGQLFHGHGRACSCQLSGCLLALTPPRHHSYPRSDSLECSQTPLFAAINPCMPCSHVHACPARLDTSHRDPSRTLQVHFIIVQPLPIFLPEVADLIHCLLRPPIPRPEPHTEPQKRIRCCCLPCGCCCCCLPCCCCCLLTSTSTTSTS
jgi:hypothetical protein